MERVCCKGWTRATEIEHQVPRVRQEAGRQGEVTHLNVCFHPARQMASFEPLLTHTFALVLQLSWDKAQDLLQSAVPLLISFMWVEVSGSDRRNIDFLEKM